MTIEDNVLFIFRNVMNVLDNLYFSSILNIVALEARNICRFRDKGLSSLITEPIGCIA